MSKADESSILTVSLPTGPLTFRSIDEIEQFIAAYEKSWGWLSRDEGRNQFVADVLDAMTPVRQYSHQLANRPDRAKDIIPNLKSALESPFNGSPPRSLVPGSPSAEFVQSLRKPLGDAIATCAFFGVCRRNAAHQVAFGAALAAMHAVGWDAQNRGQAFDALFRTASEQLNDLVDRHAKEAVDHEESLEVIFESAKAQRNAIEAQESERLAGAKEQWNEFFRAATAERTLFEQTYHDKLRLEAPAKYWEDKKDSHTTGAVCWGIVTLVAGVEGIRWLINRASEQFSTFPKDAGISYLIAGRLPMVVFAVALFWLLRILTRVFLTQVHLRSDAAERCVLAHTYLALKAQDATMTEADRRIVLKQLLRQAKTGLTKDDAAPQVTVGKP